MAHNGLRSKRITILGGGTFRTSNGIFPTLVFLCIQCYDWTEYKFTCMCVCVCVSVTLSVNSPTGQTPQQIFTVDSLKDADLRKDVPFGGLDDE